LSVGDEAFQRKCIERVREFQRDGHTILFVTHAVDMARQICDRVAVLDHGHLVALDEPGAAIRSFRDHLLHKRSEEELEREEGGTSDETGDAIRIVDVSFVHPGQPERVALLPGEPLEVRIDFDTSERIDDVEFALFIYDLEGRLLHGTSTDSEDGQPRSVDGPGTARFTFETVPLNDGDYLVTVGAVSRDVTKIYVWQEQRYRFQVMDPENGQGLVALTGSAEVVTSVRPAATRR
jgi:ABC-2 type transport system ATP-binding protein